MRRLPTLVLGILLAACSGTAVAPTTAPTVPVSPTLSPSSALAPTIAPTSVSTGSSAPTIDLSALDVCSLLDEGGVRALTGTQLRFVGDDGGTSGSGERACFWGGPFPQYVEIKVFRNNTGLSGFSYTPAPDCVIVPVAGVGTEASGGTCAGGQRKVYLLAWDPGVIVSVLVNEPNRPLEPDDLAGVARTILEEIE